MKQLRIIILLITAAITLGAVTSCVDKTTEDQYADWRKLNLKWLEEQKELKDANGNYFYTEVTADWDPSAKIYMHWFNDTSLTRGNITPLYTSQVDVKYRGELCDATPFDSSYLRTDSIYRSRINSNVEGWGIALTHMRVGDSVRVVVPYNVGYGASSMGKIKPYSVLVFDLKLLSVQKYELVPVKR